MIKYSTAKEAVQGDTEAFKKKLEPRLEGNVFQTERIRSEKAPGWESAGEV